MKSNKKNVTCFNLFDEHSLGLDVKNAIIAAESIDSLLYQIVLSISGNGSNVDKNNTDVKIRTNAYNYNNNNDNNKFNDSNDVIIDDWDSLGDVGINCDTSKSIVLQANVIKNANKDTILVTTEAVLTANTFAIDGNKKKNTKPNDVNEEITKVAKATTISDLRKIDLFNKKVQAKAKTIKQESRTKQKHYSLFVDSSQSKKKEFKESIKKSQKLTNEVLSNKSNGDVGNKNTLLHVLAQSSTDSGKSVRFFDSSKNVNDPTNSSKFMSSLENSETSRCVLSLKNLNGLGNDNENKSEDNKNNDDDKQLEEDVSELKLCLDLNKQHPILQDVCARLAQTYNVPISSVHITDVCYGSCTFEYTIDSCANLQAEFDNGTMDQKLRKNFQSFKASKYHPSLFTNSFDINDFDDRGTKSFENNNATYKVGPPGREQDYFQPHGWTRYGLKVLDRIPPKWISTGDDRWLTPFQDPGNWYRAYHGTNLGVGKQIFGTQFRTGHANAYEHSISQLDGQPIGKGVYCTPDPKEAERYARRRKGATTIRTANGPKKFLFMFQVCVDPDRTHFATKSGAPYWIIRDKDTADAIRPYGILLKEV